MSELAYCVYTTMFFQGPVPAVYDENDKPCIFKTELEAQREIADWAMMRLRDFMDGNRDFEDATTIEDYVVTVELFPDGSFVDEYGNRFET